MWYLAFILCVSGSISLPAFAEKQNQHCEDLSEYIGTATIDENGTYFLSLIACDPETGARGHGFLTYAQNDPQYQMIVEQVGPIKVGEVVNVNPFPQK